MATLRDGHGTQQRYKVARMESRPQVQRTWATQPRFTLHEIRFTHSAGEGHLEAGEVVEVHVTVVVEIERVQTFLGVGRWRGRGRRHVGTGRKRNIRGSDDGIRAAFAGRGDNQDHVGPAFPSARGAEQLHVDAVHRVRALRGSLSNETAAVGAEPDARSRGLCGQTCATQGTAEARRGIA